MQITLNYSKGLCAQREPYTGRKEQQSPGRNWEHLKNNIIKENKGILSYTRCYWLLSILSESKKLQETSQKVFNKSIPVVQVLIAAQTWEGRLHTLVESKHHDSDGCFQMRDLKGTSTSTLKMDDSRVISTLPA